jgi:hypothetical protein
MALRIVQNAARPKKVSAPRRFPRLLEHPFSPARGILAVFLQRDLYSAPVGDALKIQSSTLINQSTFL